MQRPAALRTWPGWVCAVAGVLGIGGLAASAVGTSTELDRCIHRNDGLRDPSGLTDELAPVYGTVEDQAFMTVDATPAGVDPLDLGWIASARGTGRVVVLIDPQLLDPAAVSADLNQLARRTAVTYGLPPDAVRVDVQAGCFPAAEVKAARASASANLKDLWLRRGSAVDPATRGVSLWAIEGPGADSRLHLTVAAAYAADGARIARVAGPALVSATSAAGSDGQSFPLQQPR